MNKMSRYFDNKIPLAIVTPTSHLLRSRNRQWIFSDVYVIIWLFEGDRSKVGGKHKPEKNM